MKKSSASLWLCSGTATPGGTTPRMTQKSAPGSSGLLMNSRVGPNTSTAVYGVPSAIWGSTVVWNLSVIVALDFACSMGGRLEEHFELNAVGVRECQYRTVFGLGDRRVGHVELLEPCQPLVEAGPGVDVEPHVIEPGAQGIEGFALIAVVLLEFDDGPRRRVQQQNAVPPVTADPVDFGQLEQRRPPLGTCLGVTDGKRNMRHLAESWHANSSGFTFGRVVGVRW